MIVLDVNVLVNAFLVTAPEQKPVGPWLQRQLDDKRDILLPWVTILGFCRITTDARIFDPGFSTSEAIARIDGLLSIPTVQILEPGPSHWSILRELVVNAQAHAARVTDAHLAALTLEHNATLCTSDRGFSRYKGLRTLDPATQL